MSKLGNLQTLVEPIVSSMGYELIGVEFLSQGRHSVLRIYIDKDGGITVDDCSDVSGQVSAMLDVEDPIHGEYNLEVSSPGLDRPLFTLAHFERFKGRKCSLRLKAPVNGQRKFTGIIHSTTEDAVNLEIDGEQITLAFNQIDKANIVPEF